MMFKNLTRFVAMLAAAIVSADAFAALPNLNKQKNFIQQSSAKPSAAANVESGESTADHDDGKVSDLNMDGAAVEMVLKIYGELVDKTIIVDPAVEGQLNKTIKFKSAPGQKLSTEERILAYETILEMNQIHLEPYGEKFMRALPRKDVRKEGIPLVMDSNANIGDTTRVVSMMVQLKNISTEDAQKTLDNFKSASGLIIAFERTNSLLITDTEQNINRMLEIVRAIDKAIPVSEEVNYYQVVNASATDIKTALEAIVAESQKELEKSGNKGNIPSQSSASTARSERDRMRDKMPAAPTSNSSVLVSDSDAKRGVIRGKVLILADERSNKLVVITNRDNWNFFKQVIEQLDVETTPDTVVKVYRLKYAEADEVSDMINDLIGNSGSSRSSSKDNQNRNAKSNGGAGGSKTAVNAQRKSANQRTGEAKAGELTKDNTTVLADERINGLVVMTEKELVPTIEQIIESMDIKLSQVLIETVIIEVALGDGIETGVDWVRNGRLSGNATDEWGHQLYWTDSTKKKTTTDVTDYPVADLAKDTLWSGSYGYMSAMGGGSQNGQQAAAFVANTATNLFGSAFNYVFKSDKLNLSAVINATKTDSRSKYIASPVIMTLDNKEATIEATQMRYLFKGYQYSGSTYNGSAVPDYEQKELGITIKVTPKINPNGTVMLTLEEEYSQEGADQPITGQDGKAFNAATTVTRKMSADALLENNQTVIFAGLTETSKSESESGIPILKDIPWIGKWLFGSVSRDEARTELLVFMTPYVLDDAEAAQAEAIRRKRALSDQHAWDDHGWSASKLAEPVSKMEQLRRLKDEWKKQDEERKAKMAIEQEKIKRVKELEKMSKAEREVWLEMHKEELKEEEKDELEKKMLDDDSQEELRKLAEQVKARKMMQADKTLDKTSKEYEQENEYNRRMREREAKKGEKIEGIGNKEGGTSGEEKPAESVEPKSPASSAEPSTLSKLAEETK